MSSKVAPLRLDLPTTQVDWIEEPQLIFANDRTHSDPKVGIPLYGPRSLGSTRHKSEIHIGFIGPGESVAKAREFYESCSLGVAGDEERSPFPGTRADRGFRSELRFDERIDELITRTESQDILRIKRTRECFEMFLGILQDKLRLVTQRDHPLDYVVIAIPQDLYQKCHAIDYSLKGVGRVHRDLRRAFKAMAMKFHKPTQILLDTTTGLVTGKRRLDHKSVIAWNLFTGMYFKVDGLPWGPVNLPPASCFVGISFYRPLGSMSTLRTSVVQAFDENGEGLVLRGHDFKWDEAKEGRSPHLSAEMSAKLVDMVLARYKEERKQLPQRVVIHKTSRFEPEEREGFEQALKHVSHHDLVALSPNSEVRLIRAGQYPPLRGTCFKIGSAVYLYTTGYLSSLGGYPHGHVPSPLQIADHVGDTSRSQLLREILALTKMNWNSANFDGLSPITLRFSRLVGDIMREIGDEEPEPKYKYYM